MRKKDVVQYFGSTSKVANILGIARPSVCLWKTIIPEKQALILERLTKGKLKYSPKLYGRKE